MRPSGPYQMAEEGDEVSFDKALHEFDERRKSDTAT
jgi:hypothetical protein